MSSDLPRRKIIEASTVMEQIDDAPRLLRRLEMDPADHIAGTQLESIYRQRHQWHDLVQLLLDRAAILDRDNAARVLAEVADIYVTELGDEESAFVVLQTAFSQSPDSARLADRLGRLARRNGEWSTVIDLFTIEAAKLGGRANAVASELWLRVACAHLEADGDTEAALAALANVNDLESAAAVALIDEIERRANTPELLRLVLELCRISGDEERLLRTLHRMLSIATDHAELCRIHLEIGERLLRHDDRATGEWHLVEVLRYDPTEATAIQLLTDIYKQRGEYLKAAKLLEGCKTHLDNPVDRVQVAFEAAEIYSTVLEEHTVAVNLYESALAIDPDHVGAALPLADKYYREQRWYELEPVIDMLVRRGDSLSGRGDLMAVITRRAGETAAALGKYEKAKRYFEMSLHRHRGEGATLLGLGKCLIELGQWREASERLASAFDLFERAGDRERIAETLRHLGDCAAATNDHRLAMSYYEQAFELAPGQEELLTTLAKLSEEAGDFERAVYYRQAALKNASPERRVRLLAEIGRITSYQLRDPERAITIFETALELAGDDREVLHQLVEHYSAAGWWDDAVKMISKMAELEAEPLRQGKYYQAAAVIARSEIGDIHLASDHYDRALDCFYGNGAELPEALRESCLRALKDMVKMLSSAQEWKRLEQAYRRMIKRIAPHDPIAAELWHGLGEIYRNHLGHRDSAIGSFEIASALDDNRLTRHRILVDLYESAGPAKAAEAIARRQRLLDAEPLEVDHYKSLRKLYARTKQYDRAWAACRALSFLGHADEEEQRFLDSWMPAGYDLPPLPLNEQIWQHIRDEGEDRRVTAIFELVAEDAAWATATQQKELGLSSSVPGTEQYRNLVAAVAETLAVPVPDVFVHPNSTGDVLWANARRGKELARTIAIGRDLYRGRAPRIMVAAIAKALVYSMPAYFLRMAARSPDELEAIFLAASSLSRADVPVPRYLMPAVKSCRAVLDGRLSKARRAELAEAVSEYVHAGSPYDIVAWSRSVDATSRRAALLVAGDLESVTSVAGGGVSESELAELLRHSVSESHAYARQLLGLSRD